MKLRTIKCIIRSNRVLEEIAYIIHNKFLYRWINFSGGGTIDNYSTNEMVDYCERIVEKYKKFGNINLFRKNILEIGPGRTLGVAALFVIKGANEVISVDKFNCLRKDDEIILKKLCNKYNKDYQKILKKIGYMSGVGIEEVDRFLNKKFDVIISNAVLEHLSDLKRAIYQMSKMIKSQGIMVHEVDLACHNRFAKIHPLYFLTFSDKQWSKMGSNVGQPNRYRFSHYLAFLKDAGFTIKAIEITKKIRSTEVEEIRDSLNEKFKHLSTHDLQILGFRFSAFKK